VIVAACSDKGSPGVTTVVTLLGLVWPNERVVAEMDPAGTDLALRLRLGPEPTVLALAADARSGLPGGVLRYAQPTALGVPVVVGAETAERFGPMARLWPQVAAESARWPGTVLADVGRMQPGNPALAVAQAATVVLVVARATVEGLHHLRHRVTELAAAGTADGVGCSGALLGASRGLSGLRTCVTYHRHDSRRTSERELVTVGRPFGGTC
jgi:hypothetical protein